MKLAQLQQAFQHHILRGQPDIAAQIEGDAQNPAHVRLGIYSFAYTARLVEVLGETFPAVKAALGEAAFARLIGAFVQQHPSRFSSARDYGADLPQWLAANLRGPRAQGVADLARFEWAVADVFDAADAAVLPPAALAGVDPRQWPRLTFTFSPALQRLGINSNAVAWWTFACAARPRPGRWRATPPQQWLIWRQDLVVRYRRLSRMEAHALDAARAGSRFGVLCERLSAAQAARLLHDWFSAGLIVATDVAAS